LWSLITVRPDRSGIPSRIVLTVLAGLVLTLIIGGPLLGALAHVWSASTLGSVADVTMLGPVGAVIAWHRPANPLGWILLSGVGSIAGTFGILVLPVSLGLGILKSRLYDIDRIISRTLAYAIVTGLLVGVYAGLVLLASRVLSVRSPVAVAAATLAAAALFTRSLEPAHLSVWMRESR
jgi:hypothetical protein